MFKKKVFIVEDHPVVVKGLMQVINKQDELEVVGHSNNSRDAMSAIVSSNPDIVTVDLSLKNSSGLELIKEVKAVCPNLKILVISMFDDKMYAERSIAAGANGFVNKEKVTKELILAIMTILNGKNYLSRDTAVELAVRSNRDSKGDCGYTGLLSDRELEVFELIGEGLTTIEIAERIDLGIKTIETYKNKIKEKLDIKNFTQLIKKAVEWRMINKK